MRAVFSKIALSFFTKPRARRLHYASCLGDDASRINGSSIPKNGEKFIYKAHNFVPLEDHRIGIESGILSPYELQFETRTRMWLRPSKDVKKMLQNIEDQKPLHQAFNLRGADALNSSGAHNCFTWAREHLQTIDIDVGRDVFPKLATIPKNFTFSKEEFKKMKFMPNKF